MVIAVGVVAAFAAAPAARASWLAPEQLSAQSRGGFEVALDARGDGVLAWTEFPRPTAGVLRVASRRAGAGFGAPVTLSAPDEDVRALSLAATAGGRAALVWRVGREAPGRLLVALGRLDGTFGPAHAIARRGVLPVASRAGQDTIDNAEPAIASAQSGWMLVAWLARGARGCGYVVRAAIRPRGGSFSAGRRVSGACAHAARPQVALTDDGGGVVAWREGRCRARAACRQRLVGAVIRDHEIGAPRRLAARPVANRGPAVVATGDRSVVAWRDALAPSADETTTRGRVMAAEIRRGRVGRAQALSQTDVIAGTPRLAASVGGAVAAVWQTGQSLAPVQFSVSPATGSPFSRRERVAPLGVADGRAEALYVALDRAGDALASLCGPALLSAVRPLDIGAFPQRERVLPGSGLVIDDPCGGGRLHARLALAQDSGEAILAWTIGTRLLAARRPGPVGL
jgi:hypothetical protein